MPYSERQREYHREYQRRRRAAKGIEPDERLWGSPTKVNVDALRHAILSDGRTQKQLSLDCGLCKTAVAHILWSRSARDITLDKIACALGIHMSALEAA